jgi:mono/diheme cytochrome c family protein
MAAAHQQGQALHRHNHQNCHACHVGMLEKKSKLMDFNGRSTIGKSFKRPFQ